MPKFFFYFFIQMYFIPIQQTKDLSQETFSNWQEATCGLNLEYFGATSDRSSHLCGQGIFATKKTHCFNNCCYSNRASVQTVRAIFNVETGYRLGDDQYDLYL